MSEHNLTIRVPVRIKDKIDEAVEYLADLLGVDPNRSAFMVGAALGLARRIMGNAPVETRPNVVWTLEQQEDGTKVPVLNWITVDRDRCYITGDDVGEKEMVSISMELEEKETIQRAAVEHFDTTTDFVLRAAWMRAHNLLEQKNGKSTDG